MKKIIFFLLVMLSFNARSEAINFKNWKLLISEDEITDSKNVSFATVNESYDAYLSFDCEKVAVMYKNSDGRHSRDLSDSYPVILRVDKNKPITMKMYAHKLGYLTYDKEKVKEIIGNGEIIFARIESAESQKTLKFSLEGFSDGYKQYIKQCKK